MLHALSYTITYDILYHESHDEVLLICLRLVELDRIVKEFHSRSFGYNFLRYTITIKIIQARYYYPTIFKYGFKVLKYS